MADISVRYLIIGAGISGLAAADCLGSDYLILEKENEVGGYCRTIYRGDYVWDYAGHFFHFKSEDIKKRFLDNTSPEDVIYKEKNTKILYKGDLIDYPFQKNIHQLEKQEFIDCLYDLFNREEKTDYNSFLDMLYGKFGRSIVEKFLKPYNEKLYACDLRSLDKDAMGRFFPYADIPQIISNMKQEKDNSYNNSFLYPRHGAGSFINTIYNRLDKTRVLTGRYVVSVDMANRIAVDSEGQSYSFEFLINTSPLNQFLGVLGGKYSELRQRLSYNKVLVFNLGFEKKSEFREHWIYIPDKSDNYYRIGFYDNILDSDKLSMYVEIGFGKDESIDVDEQLALTLNNLRRAGIVAEDNALCEYMPIIMDPAYVHISTDTEKSVAALKDELAVSGIYTIGRYGGWTYCSMEDCVLEADEICRKIR